MLSTRYCSTKFLQEFKVQCTFNRISPVFKPSKFLENSWIPYDFPENSLISMKITRYFNILCDWLSTVQVVICEIRCLVSLDAYCSQSKILIFRQKTIRITRKFILSDRKHSRHLSFQQKLTFSKKHTYGTRSSSKYHFHQCILIFMSDFNRKS